MTKTQTIGADGTPLLARIKAALEIDGGLVRAPETPKNIDLKNYTSPGAVPVHLRGMMELYHSLGRDVEDMARTLEIRASNCRAGDCACRKAGKSGFQAELEMIKGVKQLFSDLNHVEKLLAPALAKSLNGLDISEEPFVIASDWRIMTPRPTKASSIAEMVAKAVKGGKSSLKIVALTIDGKSVLFDLDEIGTMDANALKAHMAEKISPEAMKKLNQGGTLDGLIAELALTARLAATGDLDFESGSRPRNPFAGFGHAGFDFEELLRGFGRTPQRRTSAAN